MLNSLQTFRDRAAEVALQTFSPIALVVNEHWRVSAEKLECRNSRWCFDEHLKDNLAAYYLRSCLDRLR